MPSSPVPGMLGMPTSYFRDCGAKFVDFAYEIGRHHLYMLNLCQWISGDLLVSYQYAFQNADCLHTCVVGMKTTSASLWALNWHNYPRGKINSYLPTPFCVQRLMRKEATPVFDPIKGKPASYFEYPGR